MRTSSIQYFRHSHPQKRPSTRSVNGGTRGLRRWDLRVSQGARRRLCVHSSIAVFTFPKGFAILGVLGAIALLLLIAACHASWPLKGGAASTAIFRAGHSNLVTLAQPENPKAPSRQSVQSEQTLEYVLPAGTQLVLGDAAPAEVDPSPSVPGLPHRTPRAISSRPKHDAVDGQLESAILSKPVPVKRTSKDRSETSIGAAQKDTVREWASRAANLQPVMWTGIGMMTLVAGGLAYFGWWTKAGLAAAIGLGMVVLAQALPDHGSAVLLGGVAAFGLIALLVLYAYHKGLLDQNRNGIPDFLETKTTK